MGLQQKTALYMRKKMNIMSYVCNASMLLDNALLNKTI